MKNEILNELLQDDLWDPVKDRYIKYGRMLMGYMLDTTQTGEGMKALASTLSNSYGFIQSLYIDAGLDVPLDVKRAYGRE